MNFIHLGLLQPYINRISFVGFIDRVHFVHKNIE